ncbi:MAG TPA: DNA translocase FtsK 4TM domain-containing protein, partial [Planctomycetota bacterium]|nr:DNA translocase FtsK 4TM domain-containing protein [Planctomycetota bacterium]
MTEDAEPSQHAREVVGILMIFGALWLSVSMLSYYRPFGDPKAQGLNWGGQLGWYLATAAYTMAGAAGLIFAFLGFAWGLVLVARKTVDKALLRIAAAISFTLSLAFLLRMGLGTKITNTLPQGVGGWLAQVATEPLQDKLGGPGLWIVMVALTIVSFMLATNMAFYPLFLELGAWAKARREERGESFARAVVTWVRNMFLGLWDFLRGARLGESAAARAASLAAESDQAPAPIAVAATSALVPATVGRRAKAATEEVEAAARPTAPFVDDEAPAAASFTDLDDSPEIDEDSIAVSAATEENAFAEDEEEPAEALLDADGVASGSDELSEETDEDEVALQPVAAKSTPKTGLKSSQKGLVQDLPYEPPTPPPGEWRLPPLELLEAPDRSTGLDDEALRVQARKLEAALSSFRVEAQVIGAQVGPTVILFELEVSQGTRMNKVTQLSQEIAAALRAQSVRIIAPIPGKATIGIEVPNGTRRKVRISELVNQNAYDKKFGALPLFLGIDAEGSPIVEDLARMPHLLIAGTTGSGKSVCINTILASFLLTRSPHDVQMILIDPKMVELQMFEKIPHLMLPVVTDMRQATKVLEWAVEKMEGRYELFRTVSVKNLKGYNALGEEELKKRLGDEFSERTPRHIPYIIVVVDEFADLMMQMKKEAEQAITRLAQKSRAVGIHVILATQRPSTDVITGVIKGNLPTRIAFQVASKVDSRVILDSMGAEKLLGGGDMLYNPPQSSRIKRVQGALVEDHEIKALVDFVCTDSAQNFNQELKQLTTGSAVAGAGEGFETALDDPMWDDAVRV